MSKGMEIIENFIGRAIEKGHVYITKCLECGCDGICISMDEETELECGECGSIEVEAEELE